MKGFDLFVPLTFNNGEPIPASLFQSLQRRLLSRFGGLTFFPQPNRGFWKMGDITYRDEIVVYRVTALSRQTQEVDAPRIPARRDIDHSATHWTDPLIPRWADVGTCVFARQRRLGVSITGKGAEVGVSAKAAILSSGLSSSRTQSAVFSN